VYWEDAAITELLAEKEGVQPFSFLATILVRAHNAFGAGLMVWASLAASEEICPLPQHQQSLASLRPWEKPALLRLGKLRTCDV